MNISFRLKLFLIFLTYGLVLALAGYIFISQADKKNVQKDTLEIAKNRAVAISNEFENFILDYTDKLNAIKSSKLFKQYYELNDIIALQNYFLDMMRTSQYMMQLRLIGADGKEIVRVDRDKTGTHPYIIPVSALQDKKNRYYVNEILKSKKDSFWFSHLDLNIEYGVIEKPIQPVLRIGTPLYSENKVEAMLIINIFMKEFLAKFQDSPFFDIYIIDKEGFVILAPRNKLSWVRYLEAKEEQALPFSKELQQIIAHDKYEGKNFVSQKIALDNGEEIKVVLVPKESYIQKKLEENYEEILYVVILVILLSLPLSYFMSLIPTRLNQKVETLNKQLQKEKKELKLLLSLFDLSDTVLFKWNNDAEWSINSVSRSVKKLLGYSKEDFESKAVVYAKCIHPDDLPRVMKEVESAIAEHKFFFTHEPYRIITKNKSIKWILDHTVVVRDENDQITHFLGYLSDITELKEKEIMLNELARTDQLTQLYNRVYLDEVLMNQYYRFYRNHEACSIVMMDIDYFKEVNDKYGHLVGDKVLVEFANLLRKSVRASDIVGRWGGEEFMLVLPHTDLEHAVDLAKKLHKLINEHEFSIVGKKTASFGISTFRVNVTVEKVVDEADQALYEAKKAGRNCIKVYKAEKK
jgi:diguanylate cyclase (GGDEF)-like protein/PAS domain S-box-containing protein